ncbi:LiaF domain-containing protein [Actinoplanes sp. NPDC049596]|uniref:LiaF domain-containing protein n=1 Tax=unclassified Actinoplanes TaxID=2626549 RepID=UPI00341A4450
MDATSKKKATWFVSLLGGVKRRGPWRLPRDMRVVSVIGGLDLDLTGAELPADPVITKFSLVGGVSLRVPATVTVEVAGFRLLGGTRLDSGTTATPTITLRIRDYTVVGGIRIERD